MIKMTNKKNNDKEINSENIEFYKLKENMLKNLNFDCGDEDLNEFLLNDSIDHMKSDISIVYLCKYKKEVIGYVALSNDSIEINKEDKEKIKEKYGIFYPYYPAIKVGRLAISKNYQGKGIGTMVIDWVIGLIIELRFKVGIKYIAVDSYSESKTFYENNEFELFELKKERGNTVQMYLEIENHP
jgi:GNAT superfamily N-acetyltransferase